MNSILKQVSNHIIEVEGDFDGHGKKLSNLTNQINDVQDYNDTKDVVDQIMLEANELVLLGKRLQEGMKMTTADLKILNQELEK
jgi:uncharacterized coiled-coil DUF342 family protein